MAIDFVVFLMNLDIAPLGAAFAGALAVVGRMFELTVGVVMPVGSSRMGFIPLYERPVSYQAVKFRGKIL